MRRELWCLQILIFITILFIIYSWKPVIDWSTYQVVQYRWRDAPTRYKKIKTILYWNKMYAERHEDFMFGSGDIFKNCPVPYCYATPNRRLLDSIADFDAVMVHGIEMDLNDVPIVRSIHQRYIFFSWESPLSRPMNNFEFVIRPNYYNWTMSYRLDSDIIRPYGQIRDILTQKIISPPRYPSGLVKWRTEDKLFAPTNDEMLAILGKRKIAAWFVSHCTTNSQREVLVKALQQYFQVDVYGKCGDMECDKTNPEECYNLLERDYFFYISFENTLCKDYVTEKLYLPMKKYVIPVVYGGADYTKFAPPHSYININDFNSLKELAKFMIWLTKRPNAYATYFWWKRYYTIEETNESTLCDVCEKLHNSYLPRKSLENFKDYYTDGECINGNVTDFISDEISNSINYF